jgi:hypothetical protein
MNVLENIYPVYNLKRKSFIYKKSVSFHCMVDVIMIPNIKNFPELLESLWWKQESLICFKRSALEEIMNFVQMQGNKISSKQACDFLYQPNPQPLIKVPALEEDDCFFGGFVW